MNKKIVELDTQAKDYAAMELAESGLGGIPRFNQLYRDKFAELIVQECIDIVGNYQDKVTYYRASEKLQEHFGVN